MPQSTLDLPQIVFLVRDGAKLNDLQACAGKLWLAEAGGKMDDVGAVRKAIDAYWTARPGADPYWDFLATRGNCSNCAETFKYENLAICPNCFKSYCYRESRACDCGHKALG